MVSLCSICHHQCLCINTSFHGFSVQHEMASLMMFDHLLQVNNMQEHFTQYGLTNQDISFIKLLIASPQDFIFGDKVKYIYYAKYRHTCFPIKAGWNSSSLRISPKPPFPEVMHTDHLVTLPILHQPPTSYEGTGVEYLKYLVTFWCQI